MVHGLLSDAKYELLVRLSCYLPIAVMVDARIHVSQGYEFKVNTNCLNKFELCIKPHTPLKESVCGGYGYQFLQLPDVGQKVQWLKN